MSPNVATTDPADKTELMRSLGRLVRGLSALFWGLPAALIVCIQTAKTEILRPFNIAPSVAVTAWLLFGLWQLGAFQRQERVWRRALDRARILSLVNLGFSPFLFWWNQMPGEPFFTVVACTMGATGLLFLASLNVVLHRLCAMLPDEALREETRNFSRLNCYLVLGILLLGVLLLFLVQYPSLVPVAIEAQFDSGSNSPWLMVFLTLLPLALTMALIWKIKEVILESIFSTGR